MTTDLAGPCGSDSSAVLGRTELDALPKPVLRELSAKTLREYVCEVRAERNKYLSLYVSTKTKADRLERELEDARAACRRMAEEVARLRFAAEEVIDFNRVHAHDQYGDASKAETWSCVRTLRAALRPNVAGKRPAPGGSA